MTAACDNEHVGTRLVLRLAGERASLGQADAVDLIEILRADQLELSLSVGDFWDTKSVAELAEAQGVDPIYSVEVLRDDDITAAEAEAFMAALGL